MATIEERTITEIKIKADDKELKRLRHEALKKFISKRIDEIELALKEICEEFEGKFERNEWIKIDETFYYVNDIVAFVPDIKSSDLNWNNSSSLIENIDEKYLNFENMQGDIPTVQEAKAMFGKDNPFRKSTGKIEEYDGVTVGDGKSLSFYLISEDKVFEYGSKEVKERKILTYPICRLNGKNSKKISTPEVILSWLSYGDNGVRPTFDKDYLSNIYTELKNLRSKGYFDYLQPSSNTIVFADRENCIDKLYKDCVNGTKFKFLKTKEANVDKILNEWTEFEADDKFLDDFNKKILECDEIRANLRKYTEEQVSGMNQGHWDLFDYNDSIDSDIKVKLPKPIYSRDPKDDISMTWVGIDFGTKSTVVSYKDSGKGRKIIPINVGKVQGSSDLSDYENPSIMYFIDFDSFLDAYNSKKGRPDTRWNDLDVAHDAQNNLKNADPGSFESFLIDLKSWCGSNDIIRVKPRDNEKPWEFKKFLEIADDDPNPVEYYAYFLGLYINNMHRGKIFMRYKISFPVTYEKELLKKIVDSFEKGIKKSFPTSLLNNAKAMKKFKIDTETSEPAAYAITALQKYNFKPSDDEQEYYGVFDFGGGTSDFDFGVYSKFDEPNTNDDDDEDSGFDFSLIRFGNNGDRRLGGEKLLKYLAFEIFKINKEKLFFDDGSMIQFTLDEGRSEAECVGFESLINNQSTYANRNMYSLMEKLRWSWEGVKQNEEYLEEDYKNGRIFVDLITNKGDTIPNFELSCNSSKNSDDFVPVDLQGLLGKRIDSAVELFFTSMKEAFKKGANDKRYDIKPLDKITNINIFLAGNSSKSKLFQDILNSYIKEKTEDDSSESNLNYDYSMKEYATDSSSVFTPPSLSSFGHSKAKEILGLSDDCQLKFTIYPPLGIEEAREIQRHRGYDVKIEDKTEPTGKTGVAYGLLVDRIDVKTVSATEDGEVGFLFYLGKSQRGKFVPVLEKGCSFGEWKKIYKVKEDIEEYSFLYTLSTDVLSGNMDCREAMIRYICIDEPEEDSLLYIRAVNKNTIEWRVVKDEKELAEDVKEPNLVELK